jgi:hypothetical protein
MRRHDHDAIALLRQVEVIDIAAAAGDESRIFDPGDGLADTELVQAELLIVIVSGRPEMRATGAPRRTSAEALEMSPFEARFAHLRVTE